MPLLDLSPNELPSSRCLLWETHPDYSLRVVTLVVLDAITTIVALLLLLVLVVSTTTHHIAAWMLLVEVVVLSITMAGHTSLCSASTGWMWTATVYVLLYACSEYMHEDAALVLLMVWSPASWSTWSIRPLGV